MEPLSVLHPIGLEQQKSWVGMFMPQGLRLSRRHFLASVSALPILGLAGAAAADSVSGALPWSPFAGAPPQPVNPLGWYFFTPDEAATVEAIVDRLIPADDLSIGGKEAGCAVFIDRQLAGSFGKASRLYMKGPFAAGLPTQGYQGPLTPAGRYRDGLAKLNDQCRAGYAARRSPSYPRNNRMRCWRALRRAPSISGSPMVFRPPLFQSCAAEHDGRLLRRSALWRQQEHGRLEAGGLSRRALRLSRPYRQAQCALSAIRPFRFTARVERWPRVFRTRMWSSWGWAGPAPFSPRN